MAEITPRSASYLVRVWSEPQGARDDEALLRYYVRDLRTGEERYFSDPAGLGELVSALHGRRRDDEDREATETGRALGEAG